MEICVLSGKGGTGKTFVSTNLFNVIDNCTYIDCDVEEPNGHIFFEKQPDEITAVSKYVPQIDDNKCIKCGKCTEFCKFGSLLMILDKVYFVDDMCHSCGGCQMVCPTNAIKEVPIKTGIIEKRLANEKNIYTGKLNIGESSGTGIIKALLKKAPKEGVTVVDCPPGSDCSVIESISNADFCILVAEPTVFGIHNLDMVVRLLRIFEKPFGIVSNKIFDEKNMITEYADKNGIEILEQIPFDRKLGEVAASGRLITSDFPEYRERFLNLFEKISDRRDA